jgi:hypothetical protein
MLEQAEVVAGRAVEVVDRHRGRIMTRSRHERSP